MKTVKKLAAALLLAALFCTRGQEEKDLLLAASFDKFTTLPDFAANPETKTEGIHHDLQLRGFPGPDGTGAVVLGNRENIRYTPRGNIDLARGSLSLWVRPQNWNTSDHRHFSIFFEYRSMDFKNRVILYKINRADSICFHYRIGGKAFVAEHRGHWNPGEWHKLDAVWTPLGIKLYVDGRPAAEKKFPEPLTYPAVRWHEMGLNLCTRGWEKLVVPGWQTAYDGLKIWRRPRSAEEIAQDYEKVRPRKAVKRTLLVTAPATVPVSVPAYNNRWTAPSNSRVKISHDGKKLYLDFFVDNPGARCRHTRRDGEIYLDDAAEFHVLGRDGRRRQFIVNPAGAVYDALEGDAKWNSGIKTKVSRGKGFWRAELAIPLTDIDVGKSFKANFCISDKRGENRNYSWGFIAGKAGFADKDCFGTVELADGPQVELTSLGDLRAGKLDVELAVPPGVKTEIRAACADGRSITSPRAQLPAGKAELRITGRRGKKEVFDFSCPFTVNPPLVMEPRIYPREKTVEIGIDFSGMGRPEKPVTITLSEEKTGKVLYRGDFPVPGVFGNFKIPLPELTPLARYKLTAACQGNSVEDSFRVPDLSFLNTRTAVDHTVPAPWKPVVRKGDAAEVLDRVYTFAAGPLPSRIVSRGKELLIGPPCLRLNGEPIAWGPVKWGKNHGDCIELASEGRFAGGRAGIEGELWFDGMYKFDLTLVPDGKLAIDSLVLGWTMPEAQTKYPLLPAWTPWQGNVLKKRWDTREYFSLFWLTGPEAGLAWWCESDANWIIDPNKENIVARRDGGNTSVKISLFARPAMLKTKASYTMVFQATPPRRPWNAFREYAFSQRSRFEKKQYMRMTHVDVNDGTPSGYVNDHSIKNWISLVPVDPVKFRRYTDWAAEKRSWKSLMYAMPTHLSTLDDEYKYFYPTFATLPAIGWEAFDGVTKQKHTCVGTCMHLPIADLHAKRIDALYRDNPRLGGLYFDLMHCRDCGNTRHGCGGTDAFGKSYRTSQALHIRSYVLRVLKLHRKYGRIFGLHAHNAYFPFVHDMGDFWMPGEEMFIHVANDPEWCYHEKIAPEAWQSAWNSVIRGVPLNIIGQHERVARSLPGLSEARKKYLRQFVFAERMVSALFLYDLTARTFCSEEKGHPVFRSFDLRQDLHFAQAVFHPYWRERVCTAAEPVKVSWYTWEKPSPYNFLLCAVNIGREPVKSRLVIDWKKLAASPGPLLDLWSGKSYTEKELAEAVIPGQGMMLLVKKHPGPAGPEKKK